VVEAVIEGTQITGAANRCARRQPPTGDGLRGRDHIRQRIDVATSELIADHHSKDHQDHKEHDEDQADLPEHIQQQIVEGAYAAERHELADDLAILTERNTELEVAGPFEGFADQAGIVSPGHIHQAIGADQDPIGESPVELGLGPHPCAIRGVVLP